MMMKKLSLVAALCAATLPAHAGSYLIGHTQECPGLRSRQLYDTVNEVGIEQGLDLPKGQQIVARMICYRHPTLTEDGAPVYVYTYRATIEKMIRDGNAQRSILLRDSLERTGFGIATAANLDAAIRRETRNLIQLLK